MPLLEVWLGASRSTIDMRSVEQRVLSTQRSELGNSSAFNRCQIGQVRLVAKHLLRKEHQPIQAPV